MNCAKCGKPLKVLAKFCTACGTEVKVEEPKPRIKEEPIAAPTEQRELADSLVNKPKSNLPIVLAVLSLFIVGAVVAVVVISRNSSTDTVNADINEPVTPDGAALPNLPNHKQAKLLPWAPTPNTYLQQ